MAKNILIIDDDSYSASVLKEIFEYLHYEVYVAGNAKEGIVSYRRLNSDIVIADICMQDKSVLETIREIKKEFPEAKIIAMADIDKGEGAFFDVARTFGAIGSIRKPFN